eukprot:3713311-Prorocentrum_lima.AAC.1
MMTSSTATSATSAANVVAMKSKSGQDRVIAKYREIYHIGRLLLSKQYQSLGDIRLAAEKVIHDL